MIEVGLVAGYLMAWALSKARRAGRAVDEDVDLALDTALGRLHDVVAGKLGDDPALARLQAEAADPGVVSDRTKRRVEDAVAEAAEQDPAFADLLAAHIAELQDQSSGGVVASGERAAAAGGDVSIRADHGSAAAQTMGDVTIGAPPDPSGPGQSSG